MEKGIEVELVSHPSIDGIKGRNVFWAVSHHMKIGA